MGMYDNFPLPGKRKAKKGPPTKKKRLQTRERIAEEAAARAESRALKHAQANTKRHAIERVQRPLD